MTVEPIIVFNILITLIALWVAMAVNAKFLQPALLNKKRFAIYELRDRLALLAMRGVVDEMSGIQNANYSDKWNALLHQRFSNYRISQYACGHL